MLREWTERGTPRQFEFLEAYPEAESSSRDASKRASLPEACALPAAKTSGGCDRTSVAWPDGFGRGDPGSPSFPEGREDLVLMGDVGTGKTHMASALCVACRGRKAGARFSAASSLAVRPGRARDEGRLDREPARIGHAGLLVVDGLGFLPLDADGARLLFQAAGRVCETRSIASATDLGFSDRGDVFGDARMAAAAVDRVARHGRLLRFKKESYRAGNAPVQGGARKDAGFR